MLAMQKLRFLSHAVSVLYPAPESLQEWYSNASTSKKSQLVIANTSAKSNTGS